MALAHGATSDSTSEVALWLGLRFRLARGASFGDAEERRRFRERDLRTAHRLEEEERHQAMLAAVRKSLPTRAQLLLGLPLLGHVSSRRTAGGG